MDSTQIDGARIMAKQSVNIICLYWVGKFRGRIFKAKDVTRLRLSVNKHIDRPYKFYCLTNKMDAHIPANKIQLEYAWPGWWSKMELHRPDLPKGRTLYLDLDSHVIRSLQPILDYEGNLVMFNSRAPMRKRRFPDPGIIHRYQAATMLFDSGSTTWLYEKFCENPEFYMSQYRSDQDVMGKYLPDQPVFPDEWMAKLKQCIRTKEAPSDAIIITGQPSGNFFRKSVRYVPWLEKMARGK